MRPTLNEAMCVLISYRVLKFCSCLVHTFFEHMGVGYDVWKVKGLSRIIGVS